MHLKFLSSIGVLVAHAASIAFKVVLPSALKAAEEVEPLVDVVFPLEGPIYHKVVEQIIAVEQAYVTMNQASGSGPKKLAVAVSAVSSYLLPRLQAAGIVDTAQQQQHIQTYVNALVALLNLPASTKALPATV